MPNLEKFYLASQEANKKKHASVTADGFSRSSAGRDALKAQTPRLQPYVDPEDGSIGGG